MYMCKINLTLNGLLVIKFVRANHWSTAVESKIILISDCFGVTKGLVTLHAMQLVKKSEWKRNGIRGEMEQRFGVVMAPLSSWND